MDLFFVLSGFLITRILLATRQREDYWTGFYLRRSLRIFPLYFIFLSIYYFLLAPLQGYATPAARDQWWYWCYLQNIPATFPEFHSVGPSHFWSLAVEEHFYTAWPALIYFMPTRFLPATCAAVLILSLLSRALMIFLGYGVFYFTPCRMDGLAAGSLLAVWERSGRLVSYRKGMATVGLVVLAIIIGLMAMVGGQGRPEVGVVKFSLYVAFYACCVGLVATGSLARLLSYRFLTWTGRISYGLYVYHPFALQQADVIGTAIGLEGLVLMGLGVLIAYIISAASYYLIESKFLKIKDKLTKPAVAKPLV